MKDTDVPVSEAMRNAGIAYLHNAKASQLTGDIVTAVYQRMEEARIIAPDSPIVAGRVKPRTKSALLHKISCAIYGVPPYRRTAAFIDEHCSCRDGLDGTDASRDRLKAEICGELTDGA